MRFGFRRPSIRKRIAARTSIKRYIRHSLGLKAPRGWGWLTNPRRAAYNRIYNRTTFRLGRGCAVMLIAMIVPVAAATIVLKCLVGESAQPQAEPRAPGLRAPEAIFVSAFSAPSRLSAAASGSPSADDRAGFSG